MGYVKKDEYGDGFTYHFDNGSSEHFEKGFWSDYSGSRGTKINKYGDDIYVDNGTEEKRYSRNIFGEYKEVRSSLYNDTPYQGYVSSGYSTSRVPMKWYEYLLGEGHTLSNFPKRLSILQLIVTIAAVIVCFILGNALLEERSFYSMVAKAEKFQYIILVEVIVHLVLAEKMASKWFCGLNSWLVLAEYFLWFFFMTNLMTEFVFIIRMRPTITLSYLLKVLLYFGPLNIALSVYFYSLLSGVVAGVVGFCTFWTPLVAFLCRRPIKGLNEIAPKLIFGIVILFLICMTMYTLISIITIKYKFQPFNSFCIYRE